MKHGYLFRITLFVERLIAVTSAAIALPNKIAKCPRPNMSRYQYEEIPPIVTTATFLLGLQPCLTMEEYIVNPAQNISATRLVGIASRIGNTNSSGTQT